jgi:hypothetical protein
MPAAKKDAIELLKADHRKVEELFGKYEKARSRKDDIARQICLELTVHTLIEEEIFYPACREAGVESAMLDEAYVEHDGAKQLIAELESGSPEDEFYDAKVTVLSEEIKHHVNEEEKRGGIFTGARQADLDLDALGEQLQTRKDELVAQIEKKGIPAPITRTMKAPPLEQGQSTA